MNRETVETKLRNIGFKPTKLMDDDKTELWMKETDKSVSIILNGVDLYVHKGSYVAFEVDNWGLCVRLNQEYYYIGAICNSWENINSLDFELEGDEDK